MNAKGLAIIKKYEGLRLEAYKCPGGVWTIGYGHTHGVRPGQKVTREMAEIYLIEDIEEIEGHIKYLLTGAHLNENQWSAIVSLVYNIGLGAFERSTLRRLLPYSKTRAADEFLKFKFSKGKVLPGLLKRRVAERELFMS